MIRQDYIMRMIEQMVKVLAKILFNKEAGNYNAAINDIDAAFNSITGLDYNMINDLSANDIISILKMSKDDAAVSIKCIVIAKLLKEKTDIAKLNSDENSRLVYNYQKSISLYLEGILNNKNVEVDLSEYYSDVKEIVKILEDEIPQNTRYRLFKFYELIGEYDKAENELFRLKGLNYPNIVEEGILFFRNLEKLSEVDLMKGNLSKEEVKRGLADFTKVIN